MKRAAAALLACGTLLVGAWLSTRAPRPAAPAPDALRFAPALASATPFARALAPRRFELPRDHGPHPEFQTEWWYYTGHLANAAGRRYGFQLTFFRRALSSADETTDDTLATRQIHLAHFALSDVKARRHVFFERFARGAGGLAGARAEPFGVWLEDWRVDALDDQGRRVRLSARDEGVALDLQLEARKALVAHGERGLSRKSSAAGNASYYVGYTRLAAVGTLGVGAAREAVSGSAWFDHEWSTSALGHDVGGWDWFSLQLDDGRELMFYALRRADGSLAPESSGTLVAHDSTTRALSASDVRAQPLAFWTSPRSGARYPVRWRLLVPDEELELELDALFPEQEMDTSFVYWEGAVDARGTSAGRPLTGRGYVELTGYAKSLRGVF